MTIIIFILLVFFTILAHKKLDLAVLLIIAGTPLYLLRGSLLGVPFTLLEGMILIAFFVWFFIRDGAKIKSLFKKEGKIPYPYRLEIISVLLVSFTAVIVAGLNNAAFGALKAYFFEPLLVFILIINLFSSDEGRKKIVWSLGFSALIISVFAIYQKITGNFISNPFWANVESRRVTSFFEYPNALGLFLAPLIMMLSGHLISVLPEKKIGEKIFLITTISLSLLAIFFARSEGALVALIISFFVGTLLIKKTRIIAIVLAVIVSIGIFSYAPLRDFTITKITLNDLSGQIRKQQWIETKKMFSAGHFWLGAGLSNYQTTVTPYHQEGIFLKNNDPNWLEKIRSSEDFRKQMWQPTEIYLYPHNILLNFWTEIGLLGALLFLWIIVKFLWQSFKIYLKEKEVSKKYLALGLLTSMLVIVIHGLVDVPYFKNDLSVLFWLMIALLGGLTLKQNEKNSPKDNR